jgi:hypothetical protein
LRNTRACPQLEVAGFSGFPEVGEYASLIPGWFEGPGNE